jgi:hypothetical protein
MVKLEETLAIPKGGRTRGKDSLEEKEPAIGRADFVLAMSYTDLREVGSEASNLP